MACSAVRLSEWVWEKPTTSDRNSSLGWLPRMAAKSRVEAMQNEVKGR